MVNKSRDRESEGRDRVVSRKWRGSLFFHLLVPLGSISIFLFSFEGMKRKKEGNKRLRNDIN